MKHATETHITHFSQNQNGSKIETIPKSKSSLNRSRAPTKVGDEAVGGLRRRSNRRREAAKQPAKGGCEADETRLQSQEGRLRREHQISDSLSLSFHYISKLGLYQLMDPFDLVQKGLSNILFVGQSRSISRIQTRSPKSQPELGILSLNLPGEDMDHRKERMKSDCKKIMDSINAMCFENLNDEQVHSLVMMREIARGVVDNRVGKVSNSDVKKALSSSIEKMVESCRDVVNILGRISCEGLGEEEFQKLVRMKEIAMGIVLKRSTAVAALGGEEQADGGDDVGSEKDMYSGGVEVESRSEDDQNEVRQGVVDGETHTWNGYVPIIEGAGEERKMVVDYHEVVLRDEDAWNVGRGSVVEGMRDAGHQEQSRRVEGLMFEDDCLVVVSEFETQDVKSEVQKSWSPETPQIPISWPSDDVINLQWVQDMMFNIEQSSYGGESPMRFCDLIPVPLVDKLIDTATSILCKEPNCVQVDCQGEDSRVVVVGDIYGQFHDLLHLFEHAGLPSDNQLYVFNGNYVDRGARGLDVFLVLLAWKVLMPSRVYLLRGNHESRYCTFLYGFEEEVKTKFGEHGEYVYNKCLDCFKELPLASVIANSAYTTHGGLFRSITSSRKSKRKREESLELGSLEDLSKVKRSLIDAPDVGPNVLLTDVLWSDPSKQDGLVEKTFRERGLWWGPDCTEAFLKQSNLKLIIRSHEGPDVREDQDDFGDMLSGYSVDHVGDSGKLYTLFSAPDYPQCGEKRYNNKGVYAVLKPPNFESPSFHSFKDVGRPQADADGDNDLVIVDKPSSVTSPATGAASLSLASVSSEVDFKTLGISNPPSSSVMMGDGAGGTELVQVPKAPVVEGLPLPSELQEPHKAAYKYFLELIAGLKHMVSTREVQTRPMNEPCKSELDI